MRNRILFSVLSLTLIASVVFLGGPKTPQAEAAVDTSIIPIVRATEWDPGLNAVGGIPARTTVCSTVNPGGNIQAAIDACPAGQIVQLSAGTFIVNNYLLIKKGITLRGAGPTVTKLMKTNGAKPGQDSAADAQPIIVIGPNRWPKPDDATSQNLAANGSRGSRSITVANAAGFAAGQFVLLDANEYNAGSWTALPSRNGVPTSTTIWASDRTVFMRHNPSDQVDDPFPDSLGWFSRPGRPVNEIKEIASVAGNVISFNTPLHIDYPTSKQSQLTRYAGDSVHVKFAGVENLGVSGGSDGAIRFENAAYSWVKNVEDSAWLGEGVAINGSFRVVLRDSYIHDAVWPFPGGGGYAISLGDASSDVLVENNIIIKANKMMVARSSGAGSVVGYNYADDGYIGYDLTWQEVGINGSHMVGSHHMLFEGNESFNYDSDNTHGNAIYHTIFRNHLSGFRRDFAGLSNGRTAGLMYGSWWHTFVGNVLGVAGRMGGWSYEGGDGPKIWALGYDPTHWEQAADPKVLSTVIRDGNFDYLTNQVHWATVAKSLPNSLYLPGKPKFFGTFTWPWVDPTGATKLYSLPAKVRYDAGTPFAGPPGGGSGGTPMPTPTPTLSPTPVPDSNGLHEGDMISASGSADPDIYIINELGYKRLFLNPVIFSFYGHLGGYQNVKNVTPSVRDDYGTTLLFTNCETHDPKVYAIEITGEDTAILHHVQMTGDEAVAEDANFFKKVFCVNNNEYNWYPKSPVPYTSLSQIPPYIRK